MWFRRPWLWCCACCGWQAGGQAGRELGCGGGGGAQAAVPLAVWRCVWLQLGMRWTAAAVGTCPAPPSLPDACLTCPPSPPAPCPSLQLRRCGGDQRRRQDCVLKHPGRPPSHHLLIKPALRALPALWRRGLSQAAWQGVGGPAAPHSSAERRCARIWVLPALSSLPSRQSLRSGAPSASPCTLCLTHSMHCSM